MSTSAQEVNMEWVVTILLWFLLGWAGAHRLYVGKTGSGVGILCLNIFGVLLAVVLIGFLLMGIAWIWWLFDGIAILTGKFANVKGEFITFRLENKEEIK